MFIVGPREANDQAERFYSNGTTNINAWKVISIIALAFSGFLGTSMYYMHGEITALQTEVTIIKETNGNIFVQLSTLNQFMAATRANRYTDGDARLDQQQNTRQWQKLSDQLSVFQKEVESRMDMHSKNITILTQTQKNLPPKDLLQRVETIGSSVQDLRNEVRAHHPYTSLSPGYRSPRTSE